MRITVPYLKAPDPKPPLLLGHALLDYVGSGQTVLMRAETHVRGEAVSFTAARPVTDDLVTQLLRQVRRQQDRMTLVDQTLPGAPARIRAPGGSGPLRLRSVLLVYTNREGAVVLGAPVRADGDALALGPLTPVTGTQVLDLLGRLDGPPVAPEDPVVVGYSRRGVAWFVPASQRALLFQAGDRALDALSGQVFPQPPLLFVLTGMGSLKVFALAEDARPGPQAQVCKAPYFNVSEGGLVCLGTTDQPGGERALDTGAWTRAFFSSYFTHANTRSLSTHGGTHAELWRAAAERGTFDPAWLVGTGRTLEAVVCGK